MSTLMQIGASLHVSLSELTIENDEAAVHVVRARDRHGIRDDQDHHKFFITRKSYGSFEVFIHTVKPESANADQPYTHGTAQECIYVLHGGVEVLVGNHTTQLNAGDAMEYRSNMPHLVTNRSSDVAEILFVVGPDEP